MSNDYFEIRLESIGGLGANLCGKMLGELGALYLSLNASGFSSYGSEKRGSPVKSYIRWCDSATPIRINSPILTPHILCIFHEGLLGKHPVLTGIGEGCKVILNTALSEKEAQEKWDFKGATLFCLDAQTMARESKSRINMVLLGAIAKATGFVPLDIVEALCKDTIGQKYPHLIEANLEGVRLGFQALTLPEMETAPQDLAGATIPLTHDTPFEGQHFAWGYDNAPIGGVNIRPGSTVSNDLSPSREGYIPLFIQDRCINCGLCDSTCPDLVFQFRDGVNCGLDYFHCKGCLRCVEICPTNALVQALEKEHPEKPWFVPNKDLLPDRIDYEKTGANSWVTSDSYLVEERINGGIL